MNQVGQEEGKIAPREREENSIVASSSSSALGAISPKGTHRLYGGPNRTPLTPYWLSLAPVPAHILGLQGLPYRKN